MTNRNPIAALFVALVSGLHRMLRPLRSGAHLAVQRKVMALRRVDGQQNEPLRPSLAAPTQAMNAPDQEGHGTAVPCPRSGAAATHEIP
jgi:hypothetical protein